MDEKTLEEMLKRAPDLVEILDYFILISEDTFYHRYHCGADDKDCIERIYGNSFLDIADLNKLPTNLAEIIKRHIRV